VYPLHRSQSVPEIIQDGGLRVVAYRCIHCGDVIDERILVHRRNPHTQRPTRSRRLSFKARAGRGLERLCHSQNRVLLRTQAISWNHRIDGGLRRLLIGRNTRLEDVRTIVDSSGPTHRGPEFFLSRQLARVPETTRPHHVIRRVV
jgi:hypothetical protein